MDKIGGGGWDEWYDGLFEKGNEHFHNLARLREGDCVFVSRFSATKSLKHLIMRITEESCETWPLLEHQKKKQAHDHCEEWKCQNN